ncbi:MAG: thiamine pyrophosphate-binding protein [Thermomicrobiales bacterium]|nr:thiamine pyrophosphate-binding protein [Thermomicrobiales bacterium]
MTKTLKSPAKTSSTTPTGGDVVVACLASLGIRFVFGVPGGQTLSITDGILRTAEMRFVTTRHEGAAACMADAIGRMTGEPGVCLATTGPGATNMITGIGGAFRDSSPVIAITCNNRLGDFDRDDAQGADHVALFRPLVKWARLVVEARTISQVIEEAYLQATSGCPGPVLVDFARDVIEARVDPALLDRARRAGALRAARAAGPSADPVRMEEVADRLRQARRPSLWLGNGAKLANAGEEALRLATILDAPVLTTFNGIGAVPTTHELVFGALSRMGTELSSRVLADTDVVIAVGNSLNAISTSRWSLKLPETIIQIDVDPTVIGRHYAPQTLGVLGDARKTVATLADVLGASPPSNDVAAARRGRLDRLAGARERWWKSSETGSEARPGKIAPDVAIRAVRAVVPDEAVAIFDAGTPGIWSYLWEIRKAGTYMKPVGYGNMGFAVPAAVAAKLQNPGTPIVAFVGDGSLGMTLGELETVAREKLPMCIVVLNDCGYGNIRQEQIVHFGGRTIGVDLTDVDFAGVARACGMKGKRVTTPEALADAVAHALAANEPWLVDAAIDPDVNAWTFPLFKRYEVEG